MSDVIVIGAGLAGLAAATALSSQGAEVTVIDRKPFVGGRAYSYEHPALHEVVDCQHVLLGCCTNLRALCEDAGIGDRIRWYEELTFLETNGNSTSIRPGALPAPFHSSPSFLRASMLGLADKVGVARGLVEFLRGYPADDRESVDQWLKRTHQSERAIRHFWEPVIVGALNDSFENCSTRYAGQVFHESFIKSAEGGRLGIPPLPLSEFYGEVARHAEQQGSRFLLTQSVDTPLQRDGDRWLVHLEDQTLSAKNVIVAVPFEQVQRLLPTELDATSDLIANAGQFRNAPITTVHLWFDREITDLDHAVLLDTGIQWIFHKSRIRKWPASAGSYVELVISASHPHLKRSREDLLSGSLEELSMFFPAVKKAELRKSGILKEARATFSVTPGLDQFRPSQKTELPGLCLAGDWTQTGWPSTMEGAVRSGFLAAGEVLDSPRRFLRKDLPAQGLMRWLPADSSAR